MCGEYAVGVKAEYRGGYKRIDVEEVHVHYVVSLPSGSLNIWFAYTDKEPDHAEAVRLALGKKGFVVEEVVI